MPNFRRLRARKTIRVLAVLAAAGLIAQPAAAGASVPPPPSGTGLGAPPAAGSAAAAALRARHGLGAPARSPMVPGHHAPRVGRRAAIRPGQIAHRAPAPAWPGGGAVTITVPAPTPPNAAKTAAEAGTTAAASPWSRAGHMPVWVAAPRGASATTAPARVRVDVAAHAAAVAAGTDGLLFTLSRADGATAGGEVRVKVSYAGFGSAAGGGFGSRLALFEMPACALTTPKARHCRAMTPVLTTNHWKSRTLSAVLPAAPAGSAPLVFAASSTTSGGSGDFKATSLTPSSQWQVGLQSGDFTSSYPLRVPPPIAGAAPALALGYDSGASDGETAQSNSQPGQAGEGFSLSGGGFIERKYASCADHVGDASNTTDQNNKTGDLCWDGPNGYLSMGGHSGQVIRDSATGTWKLSGDDGSTVVNLSNKVNGARNGEAWEVITPDGTQYYFGLGQLPGWVSGNPVTNSAWTVPVVGLKTGDPCHNASYASSFCAHMPWRWNLDLVVDPNGNATEYYYSPQTNYYAYDSYTDSGGTAHAGTPASYMAGGVLTDIFYGAQVNAANGNNAYAHRPFDIQLGYSDRCTLASQSTCDANHTQTNWPDTPWDLYCASAAGCTGSGHQAPAFFDTQMLTSVTTSLFEGSNPYQTVDTWTLGYSWLSADVNSDLVLSSITRQGNVGGAKTLPKVTFGYTGMNNRVLYDSLYPSMQRYRMTSVISETGAQTDVAYNAASCQSGSPPDPSSNTWPCFPQYWTAGDFGGNPKTLWFYKYTVSQVNVQDATGGQPLLPTSYTYCNNAACTAPGMGAAWHYDTNIDLVPAKHKSWDQWRGYRYVHMVTGSPSGTQSETDYTFLRGMDGDPLGNNTFRDVTVAPSRPSGPLTSVADAEALNGFQLEKVTYKGLNTAAQVSDQISWPWTSQPTATTGTQPWGKPLTAVLTGTAEADTYTPLSAHANGGTAGTRQTQVANTYNGTTGLLLKASDLGDVAASGQALCATYSYPATPSAAGLLNYPTETKTTAGACGAASPATVSDTRYFYDSQAFGTAPTAGNVTETDVYSAADPGVADHWVQQSRNGYDSYGRVISAKDAAGNTTTTGYTSAYGAGRPTTQITVTSPLTVTTTATTTTDNNPAWGLPDDTIDPNNETTSYRYDPLGRVTGVWLPGQPTTAGSPANYAYSYALPATDPPSVSTTRLTGPQVIPITTVQLYDSLLRPRQTQVPGVGHDGGMVVTDTFYDSRGNTVIQNGPYAAAATPSGSLWLTTEPAVPDETATAYDGANRVTQQDFRSYGTLKWDTTWSYPGADAVTMTPPSGGTISATYTDGRGRTAEIDQYHSTTSATGAYDDTTYSYTRTGLPAGITDPGGNHWANAYDLLGRKITATDPDTGTTTSSYNDLGQLTSVTDTAGKVISWKYDPAGRKTAGYAATPASQASTNQLAAWTYDTPAIGKPATATSYVGGTAGAAYKETITSYDLAYHPTSTTYQIPSDTVTGALAGSYIFGASYNIDGTPATATYPAGGGLTAETVNFGYNNKALPYSAWSTQSDYAEAAYYTPEGQPAEIDLGTSVSGQWSRMLYSYDTATLRLTQTRIQRQSTGWANDTSTSYGYDPAGNIQSASDSVTGDNQCYNYDYLARLTAAWAQSAAACPATQPGPSGLGGPAPYQQTLSYDSGGTAGGSTSATTGNITASTLTTGAGSTATTTQTSYTYPGYGASQPHTPTSYTTTTNGSAAATTQTWTGPGQLATSLTSGTTTTYNWNGAGATPGQLASVTAGSTTTSYRYDAPGNLLVVKDGSTARLYLPGEELAANGSTVTATRYYTLGGKLIAARTSPSAVSWLFTDPHGTPTVAINASTQNLTWRYYTPFGQFRPPVQGTWPGTRRYVGGTFDSTTGLTNLGAREYNPATPAFISPDPILDPYTSASLNPYGYAANNPVTNSDPTGLSPLGRSYSDNTDPYRYLQYATYHPAPWGTLADAAGGAAHAALGAVSSAVHFAGLASGQGLAALRPNFLDNANAALARHFDTSSFAWGAGGLGVNIASLAIPGGAGEDLLRVGLRVGAGTVDRLASATGRVAAEDAPETFFRTMSKANFAQLNATARVPATSETFISPSQAYAQRYAGITVRFSVRGGTQDALAGIGIRDSSAVASAAYPGMPSPLNFSGWTRTSAYFKGERGILNIGLGRGPGLDIFNDAILGFEVVP